MLSFLVAKRNQSREPGRVAEEAGVSRRKLLRSPPSLKVLLKSASARLPLRKKADRKQGPVPSGSGDHAALEHRAEENAYGNGELASPSRLNPPDCAPHVDWPSRSCMALSGRSVPMVDTKKLVENWANSCSKMSSKKLQLVPVSSVPMNITMLKQSKRRLWMVSNPLYVGYQDDELGSEKMIKSCRPRFH